MVSIRLSLLETLVQNQLAASVKSLLHTSKKCKVEVPWCYCNTDMKSLRKVQKRQNIYWKFHRSVKTTKMAKFHKMANCVFSWPVYLKNGQIFQNAMKWPTWKPCSMLWHYGFWVARFATTLFFYGFLDNFWENALTTVCLTPAWWCVPTAPKKAKYSKEKAKQMFDAKCL